MITLYDYYNGYLLFYGSELKCLEYMDQKKYHTVSKYPDSWYVISYA